MPAILSIFVNGLFMFVFLAILTRHLGFAFIVVSLAVLILFWVCSSHLLERFITYLSGARFPVRAEKERLSPIYAEMAKKLGIDPVKYRVLIVDDPYPNGVKDILQFDVLGGMNKLSLPYPYNLFL